MTITRRSSSHVTRQYGLYTRRRTKIDPKLRSQVMGQAIGNRISLSRTRYTDGGYSNRVSVTDRGRGMGRCFASVVGLGRIGREAKLLLHALACSSQIPNFGPDQMCSTRYS